MESGDCHYRIRFKGYPGRGRDKIKCPCQGSHTLFAMIRMVSRPIEEAVSECFDRLSLPSASIRTASKRWNLETLEGRWNM